MILVWLALSLHTFSLIPPTFRGRTIHKQASVSQQTLLPHAHAFFLHPRRLHFTSFFLVLVPFTIMVPKKKRIQMLTTNGKLTRRLINGLFRPQVNQVTRTKFLPDQQPQIPLQNRGCHLYVNKLKLAFISLACFIKCLTTKI